MGSPATLMTKTGRKVASKVVDLVLLKTSNTLKYGIFRTCWLLQTTLRIRWKTSQKRRMEPVGTLVFDKYLPLIFMILTPGFTFTFFSETSRKSTSAQLTVPISTLVVLSYHQSCCIKHSIYTVLIRVLCSEIENADFSWLVHETIGMPEGPDSLPTLCGTDWWRWYSF